MNNTPNSKSLSKYFLRFALPTLLLIARVSLAQPSVQASDIIISPISGNTTSLSFNWSNGNGSARIVIISQSGSTFEPVDGIDYAANSSYGTTPNLDGGGNLAYCVFDGAGTSVTVSNLVFGSIYTVHVYEYDGSGATTLYNRYESVSNPATFTAYNANGNFSVPTGIYSVKVQGWGAGGGGGGGVNCGNGDTGSGGGGGAYEEAYVSVIPSGTESVTIGSQGVGGTGGACGGNPGSPGSPTIFGNSSQLVVNAGIGGNVSGALTPGGSGSYPGGQGGFGSTGGGNAGGGGGGSSAGVTTNGVNGGNFSTSSGGAGGIVSGGGSGGTGGSFGGTPSPQNGLFPGGGGGGGGNGGGAVFGGNGADGFLIVSYDRPTISYVSAASDSYSTLETVTISVTFSETVFVNGGTPELTLETGTTDQVATWSGGDGTSTLTFDYVVQTGDNSADLDYVGTSSLNLNGATIANSLGNVAITALPSPGADYSLSATSDLIIDTTPPSVVSVTSTTTDNTYGIGFIVSIDVEFDEDIYVAGNPIISLETGLVDQDAVFSNATANIMTFNYEVQAGDETSDLQYVSPSSLSFNGSAIHDLANNTAILTLPALASAFSLGSSKDIAIDGVVPTVIINQSGAQPDPTSSLPISFDISFDEEINPLTFTTADFTFGGTAGYTGGASISTLNNIDFTITIPVDGPGTIIPTINGGGVEDLAGNTNQASSSADNSVTFTCEVPTTSLDLVSSQTSCSAPDGALLFTASTPSGEPSSYTMTLYTSTLDEIATNPNVPDGSIGFTFTGLVGGEYVASVKNNDNGCLTYSESVVVDSPITPDVSLGSSPQVSQGTTSTILSYSVIDGSPDEYNIDFDATAEGQGFMDVSFTTLPTAPPNIIIAVPAGAVPSVYNGTLRVRESGSGCISALTYPFTVTITSSNTGFITTWKTDNPGTSNTDQITIPTTGGGYNYDVDWGDGQTSTGVTGDITHTYSIASTYTVAISGTFPRIYFNNAGDRQKLLTVEQWGDIVWASMAGAFWGCSNLTIQAIDAPDLSMATNMGNMFEGATSLNQSINHWDVSNISVMKSLFFNCPNYNQDLSNWDVSSVTDMEAMFGLCSSFNQPLNSWDVSSASNMAILFFGASSFNQPLNNWNVGNVQNMGQMFQGASSFNQDIGGWDVSSGTNLNLMFANASSFNQSLANWNISNVTGVNNMLNNAALSTANYDATLIGWSTLDIGETQIPLNITFGATGLTYCEGENARTTLLGPPYNWTINGDSKVCPAPVITAVTVPNVSMKISDVVTATITVNDNPDDFTLQASTIGGFALSNLVKIDNTTYEADFTVTAGGTDVAAGSNIPVNITLNGSGGNSAPFTTAIVQGSDPIDANIPVFSATAPASSSTVSNTQVSYTLSETIASGTITWSQTGGTGDGGSPHVQTLTGVELNSGAHNNITLTNNPTLVDGAIYTIAFAGTDAAGQSSAALSNTNVAFNSDVTAPLMTFSPVNGATGVAINSNLTVSFNEAVRNIDNTTLTAALLSLLVELKLTNNAGAAVPFNATIDVTNRLITIDPTSDLAASTLYYLELNPVEDFADNATTASSITFTTAATPAPTTQASNITFTSVASTSITVNWANGNGTSRLVVARQGSAVNSNPVDATTYTGNAAFGSGTQIGTGNYVVYDGTGTSVPVTGLTAGTTYHFQVFEFNGSGATSTHLTTTSTGNPASQTTNFAAPTTQATNITFASVASTSMTLNWTNGNGTNRIVLARSGSAVNSNPTNGTTYTANAAFGSGTQVGTGNYVVYSGTGSSVSVTGLTPGTTYHFRVYEFNGTGATSVHLTTTATGNPGSQSTLFAPPTTQATNVIFSSVAATSMTVGWTNGNGSSRIVVARSGAAVNSNPLDATSYTANAAFGSGTQIGTGNYVVYSGTGTSVNITGLTSGVTYHFRVYEFNGTATQPSFLTSTGTGNPASQTTLLVAPTVQATNIVFSTLATTSMTLTWTNGDGASRLVVARSGSAVNSNPVNGTTYAANAAFASGTQLGTGNYVVYSGTGNSVSVTGLSAGTTYHFRVFEFNGSAATSTFMTATATGNPASQSTSLAAPTTQATSITFSTVASTSITVNWTNGNGSSRLVVARSGSAVNSNPANGTTYTANAAFGNVNSEIGTGNFIVYSGTGNSVSVTGLTAGTTYHFRVFEFNGTGLTSSFLTATATANPASQATSLSSPTTQSTNIVFSSVATTSMTLTWTNGNGPSRLVLGHEAATVNSNPVNGTTYTANATFGTGTEVGTGNYVVYSGTGNSVSVTGLTSGTTYHFQVFEFNGSAATSVFLTSTATGNPASQITLTPPIITAVAIPNTAMKIGDVVTATITVTTSTESFTLPVGSTIGGFVLSNLVKTNSTTYTANFTVTAGGTDVAAGSDIPLSIVLNGAGGNSAPFTTAIAQGNDPIDANAPTYSAIIPVVGSTVADAQVSYTLSETLASGTITWTRTGGTADPNVHTQTLTGAELTAGSHDNITLTNNPVLVNRAVYSVTFAGTDAAGNVATPSIVNNITYEPDAIPPVVFSINYKTPTASPTNATSLTFQVAFKEDVIGVTGADFTATVSGVTVGAITVNPLGANIYDVTIANVSGNGTVRLDVLSNATITDLFNNAYVDNYTSGPVYTVDTVVPVISATGPASNSTVINTEVSYSLSEALASGTITWTRTGGVEDATVHSQTLTGSELTVGDHSNITLANAPTLVVGTIYSISFGGVDAAGNTAAIVTNTDVTYAPDVTPPTVVSISYQQPANALTNEKNVTFRVVFSEPVTHVDAADFTKTLVTVFGGTISVTPVDESTYEISFAVSGSGTVRLDVLAAATIMDLAGNDFNSDFTGGAVYTIDQTPPVFSSINPNPSTTVNGTEVGYTLSEELASGTITWTRTGGTEDPNIHVQELAVGELTKGLHPSALLMNSPTLVAGSVYSIAFNGIDLAGNSSQTVVVNSIVYQPTANKLSDIVENTNFSYPQNIDNIIFQEPADIQNTGTSIVVAKFTIRDGGANLNDVDPFPTTLTGLTLDLGANSSMINRIALYDDAGEIEFEGSDLKVANQTVSFTNIAIECPDNSELTFSIRVSFAPQVTDNSQLSLTITGATTETGKSGLAAVDGGSASTSTANSNNQIEVTATTFKFIQQPTNAFVDVEMSPAVSLEAVDENGNRDLDFEGSAVLTSSGSLSGDPTVLLTEGFGTYSSLVHSAGGAGLTLTASGGSNLQDGTSALYDIYDDNDPIPLSIHSLITPTAHDANNNVLYIENIDFFPENTVKLIDRYGVSVKSWVNFSNYDSDSPEQPDFNFSGLGVGNYICIVQYKDVQGDKRNQSQMITVLK